MLCLGLDSGTTTCKGLVLEVNSGKVLAQASAPHSFIDGLPRGHVEQDPQTWCDAAEHVIHGGHSGGRQRSRQTVCVFLAEMRVSGEEPVYGSQPSVEALVGEGIHMRLRRVRQTV